MRAQAALAGSATCSRTAASSSHHTDAGLSLHAPRLFANYGAVLPSGPEPPGEEAEPDDLDKSLREELSAHCDRFGEASPIQQVTFDPDNVAERFRRSLQERADVIEKVTRAVQLLQLPLGMLAEAVGRPYALAVIQRAAGIVPAYTPVESEYDAELATACDVLTGASPRRVVADA